MPPIAADGIKNYPALNHPRERENNYPIRPRTAISTAAFASDLQTFTDILATGDYGAAFAFIKNNGFNVRTVDVGAGIRAAVVAFAQRTLPRSSGHDCFDDSGGAGAWGN